MYMFSLEDDNGQCKRVKVERGPPLDALEVQDDILAAAVQEVVEQREALEDVSPVLAFVIEAFVHHLLRARVHSMIGFQG